MFFTQKLSTQILLFFSLISFNACSKKNAIELAPTSSNPNFSKGADISWLPQMEATGFKFYDKNGKETDCLQILKDNGMNAIRLRTWVNPSNHKTDGHCSSSETVAMAVRAKKMGFRIMINFHYSDSWADPSKQVKPAAWASHNLSQLKTDVYDYTFQVMSDLKTAGVTPEWVQVGNEINPGLLLPEGSSSNLSNVTQLLNKGYEAVKAVSPTSLVIIHLANGTNNSLFRWFFDGLTANQAKYDVIGMSYYPFWDEKPHSVSIGALSNNINDMISRFNKKIMIVETGELDTKVDECYTMLSDVINLVRNLPNETGLGVLYWEPQGASSWSNYGLSCWQSNGKPTRALEAFLE